MGPGRKDMMITLNGHYIKEITGNISMATCLKCDNAAADLEDARKSTVFEKPCRGDWSLAFAAATRKVREATEEFDELVVFYGTDAHKKPGKKDVHDPGSRG